MLKRPFKSVIARIAIVALALSLVFPFIPAALAQSESTSVSYAENGMAAVATFTATDDEGDAVAWGLEGDDAGDFEISSGGVLTFKESPDFESPADANEDNTYSITLTATGTTKSTHAVTVTVTDIDEDGKVNLTQPQPQVSRGISASLVDEDAGVEDESWQWARSSDKETWADIAGATTDNRTPTSDDEGMYLRATVTYADKFGAGKTASGVSENPVEARTVSNAAPSFADHDTDDATDGVQATRAVDEGKKGANVGKAVSAKDADNDILLYTIDDASQTDFSIDSRTGQIKTKTDTLTSDNSGTTGDDDGDGEITRTVIVTVTDPSGATNTATVTVTINDVNDSPAFGDEAPKELWVTENATGSPLRTGAAADATLLTAVTEPYVATDADAGDAATTDSTATPPTVALTYEVGGADKDSFEISDAGVLTVKADHEPDFEKQSSYSITIIAMDDEQATAELEVTVTVTNDEDAGTVTLTQREPQVGRSVLASLSDEDGGIGGASWQWYRNATSTTDAAALDTADGAAVCAADTDTATLCRIDKANSPSYTPVAADAPTADTDTAARLAARVTYTDKHVTDTDGTAGDDGDSAFVITQANVQASAPDNTAPKFNDDQDPNTAGNQPDAMRSVAENEDKGTNVGDPITAEDANGDLMVYSLSGPDADSFTIGNGLKNSATATPPWSTTDSVGQIKTAEKLDYETKSMYTVVVTATDPSGATDTINVIISVTDVNDKPVVELNVAPQFAADSADREVAENSEAGANVGDPVAATDGNAGDTVTYALSGEGADAFAIDGDGQITVAEGADLDFEAETNSYTVTVTATDAAGESDTITVNISVTNVNETPAVTGPEGGAVNYAENGTDPVGTFTASDPDDGDSVTWSLSGADAGSFEISEDGVLSFVAPAPEEEEPAETNGDDANGDDANGDDANGDDTNGDDTNGDDTNGDDTNGDDTNGDDTNGDDTNGDDTNGDDTNGDDTNGDDTNGEEGNGEEMMAFSPDFEMPGDADGDNVYEVTVTATDAGGESASVDVTVTVTDVDEAPVNTAPAFATESVTLSVDENSAAGANVGDPVVATDANEGDEISYTLADESGNFEIWPSGQITVAEGANLDFETQSTYTVTVTASDGTDSSSVEVTINIGNVGLASPYDADDNGAITKAEAVNAVQDYFDDEVSREAVLEVIRTYFG